MRSLVNVINALVEVAPDLKDVLASTQASASFAAPEMQSHWWNQCAVLLNQHAANHEKATELMAIFGGQQ